ncbi:aspartyl-phosphate phosphatase Spo0E family protein [Paenibacillus sp. SI8]|uniref:aspartyl-phosphate phosphatase Spo0E family protein n=1 Tax=unclassified Paenibacillus TaxID=185978 RepID=UPI003466C3D2
MESTLKAKIEALRYEMFEQAWIHGSLTHDKVVEVSQLLDRYILVYQKHILKKVNLKLIG